MSDAPGIVRLTADDVKLCINAMNSHLRLVKRAATRRRYNEVRDKLADWHPQTSAGLSGARPPERDANG